MTDPIVSPNTESDNLKRCTKCGVEKPATAEYFRVDKSIKSGLASWCHVCHRAYMREYNRAYYRKNGEKLRETARKWRETRGDYYREYLRKYYRKNGERFRKYRRVNRDKIREGMLLWRKANPERYRVYARNRRARKLQNGGTHTTADIRAQYDNQRGKCWWCGKKVGAKYHVDHRVPLVRGGSNAPENLVIACPKCNQSKNNKLPHEWSDRLL